MATNNGKLFETHTKNSFKDLNMFLLRLNDQRSFNGQSNPSDFITFYNNKFIFLEAKTTSVKRLPFANFSNSQKETMIKVNSGDKMYNDMQYYVLVKFLKEDYIFLIDSKKLIEFKETNNRKSFPLDFFKNEAYKLNTLPNKRVLFNIKEGLDNI